MENNKKIFCVIPVFNESGVIGKVIDEVRPLVDGLIIVDDGSCDDTARISADHGATVVSHILNRGQGAALETGNSYCLQQGADIVFHFDGDGQFLTDEIKDVLEPLEKDECDIVFGSRFLGKETKMPVLKKHVLFPLARIFNQTLGVRTTDPQCGFRAMNRLALEKIKINNDGSAHCSEILEKASRFKLRIKEVPITVVYNEFGQGMFGGKGSGKGGFRIIKDIIIQKIID
jgi:polyprenyl-phospho-N-acetylgalactosaminyl synthase